MAQTRRKTKHRGNAAGVVESRGRTGRKPTAQEKKGESQGGAVKKTVDRRDRPPTWGNAFIKAMFAAVLMLVVLLVIGGSFSNSAIALFPIALIIYTPISYYTDRWAYQRRQRAKARGATR